MSPIAKVAQQTPYARRVAEPEASHTLRGHRKIRVGRVMSNRMQKSIVVRVAHLTRHAAYERVVRRGKTFMVHDEENRAKVGDWVKIVETRPISRQKRWRLVEVLRQASSAPALPEEPSESTQESSVKVPRSHRKEASS